MLLKMIQEAFFLATKPQSHEGFTKHVNIEIRKLYSSALRKLKRYSEADKLLNSIPSTWNDNTNILMEMALVKIGMSKDDEANNYCLQCWRKGSSNETGIYTCLTSFWRWECSRKATHIL